MTELTIHFERPGVTVWHGDCLDVMRAMPGEFGEVPHERDIASAVLTAVFGARDADAPGDGGTLHDRDGAGICKLCGEGLSGATIVDGETPCAGRGAS